MSGVKGRSGRKAHYDEMTRNEIVDLSFKTIREYLLDANISLDKRVDVAKTIASRAVPQEIKQETSHKFAENITLNRYQALAGRLPTAVIT